ncbi:hypothetical protein [Erythrobacter sp. R86502]|uniref:hypothetical protein n=1 Tax=Erythrobacter sp. R86502 TaxID=3093846 RepID=UPI0036D24BB8
MRYAFAFLLLLGWLLSGPWIAKGYGDWRVPLPNTHSTFDLAIFYFLPIAAIAIAVSTYRAKRTS